jgi:predicted dehydrogenase
MADKTENLKVDSKKISRREVLASAAAVGAFTIVPRHVLGGVGQTPPSEKLNIACVGAGGMGENNIENCSGENIVALCDVDFKRARETFEKYPKVRRFKDFRVMLDKMEKEIAAVIVATPDHTHAVIAMAAMKMGKHVYVQKPLTRTVYESRMLTEAARKYKVATQMGNQGHSREDCRLTKEWIADGAIGPVREVHCWTNRPVWPQGLSRPKETPAVPDSLDWDLWLGPAPYRPYHPCYLPFNWRAWMDFGCGALGDMACHIMDSAFWALDLKYPTSVEASCSEIVVKKRKRLKYDETYPPSSIVHYTFPPRGDMPEVKLHWYDGGLLPERPKELEPGRKMPSNGTIFVGDKGKMMCTTYGGSPRIIPESKMQAYKRPAKTLKRIKGNHEQNWIDACKGGEAACSNFDYSGPFNETVVMGNFAIRTPGERLEWDGENMRITNNEEANRFVKEPYRQGWTL